MTRTNFTCHDCGATFAAESADEWGLYAFTRCPSCGGARTTLSTNSDDDRASG